MNPQCWLAKIGFKSGLPEWFARWLSHTFPGPFLDPFRIRFESILDPTSPHTHTHILYARISQTRPIQANNADTHTHTHTHASSSPRRCPDWANSTRWKEDPSRVWPQNWFQKCLPKMIAEIPPASLSQTRPIQANNADTHTHTHTQVAFPDVPQTGQTAPDGI